MNFVHLHVHSEYSLLDGLPKIKNLVSYVKELGMNSVALTDHGVMYGAIEFYKECLTQGIKPIIGMEGYVVNSDHRIKESKEDKSGNHLLLLAKDSVGYQNLMKISTIAYLEGFYYRPRIDKKTLEKYHQGLIVLSSCLKSEIGQLLVEGKEEKAKEIASWYQETFGQGNYYLEIQRHQYQDYASKVKDPKIKERLKRLHEEEELWIKGVIKISREQGIPLVATNDVHYLRQKDAYAQDVLVCVSTGKTVNDQDRIRYVDVPTLHLRSPEEMKEVFSDLPDALENSVKIAEKVEIKIELGKWLFPNVEIPEKKDPAKYLEEVAWKNLTKKFSKPSKEVNDRLTYELEVIIKKGYASYFLMMAQLVNWCTKEGIVTNTRGSAAGSLVSYSLGITSVDPMKYGLPFERFLNPFRPKPPDIDLDIADNRREELIQYIVKEYGAEKVAQICTFGRMLARAAVRDVGRVLGHPYSFPDRISKLIPLGSQGFPMTINHALEISGELKAFYKNDKEAKRLLDLAQEIEGNARHASVHAAGIVISPEGMTNFTPLQLEPNGDKVITQYEMHACEEVGLVKFDVLGIRNLSILTAAMEIIKESLGEKIDLAKIPMDDKKTFEMLSRGETMGAFQLGGTGMTKWLKELKPNRVEDIMVMIALFRPGPMANIPEYIARKNGKNKISYLHPKMEKFLDKSYGILVYQEDVLFTALELAGYNWETVDKLRNAIGKKIPSEMTKQHEIFVEGCQKHSGLSKEEAEKIWDLFVPFQGYGFNKAHAASYGIVSYQTAYLKAHFPVEYMTALLTAESGDTEKVTEGIEECRRMGVKVLPPDINLSQVGFTIEDDKGSRFGKAIRFGLSAIKNVGEAAISAILSARKDGDFKSLTDFCQRVNQQKVNKKVLESLIKVGAMDRFGPRARQLAGIDRIRLNTEKETKKNGTGQTSLFAQEKKTETKIIDLLPEIEELSRSELLSLERDLLGFYLTEHPLTPLLASLSVQVTHKLSQLNQDEELIGQRVKVGGMISSLRVVLTKNKQSEMAFVTLEDETGRIEGVVFPKTYALTRSCWLKEQVVLIDGKLERKEETLTLIIENASLFSEETTKSRYDFTIRVPKGTKPKFLLALNQLLKDHPGRKKGILLFEQNGTFRKLALSFGVDYNEKLEKMIKEILSD